MHEKCKGCVYASNSGGDITFCLALTELLEEAILCDNRLYREADTTIPRDEDLIQAFKELPKR